MRVRQVLQSRDSLFDSRCHQNQMNREIHPGENSKNLRDRQKRQRSQYVILSSSSFAAGKERSAMSKTPKRTTTAALRCSTLIVIFVIHSIRFLSPFTAKKLPLQTSRDTCAKPTPRSKNNDEVSTIAIEREFNDADTASNDSFPSYRCVVSRSFVSRRFIIILIIIVFGCTGVPAAPNNPVESLGDEDTFRSKR